MNPSASARGAMCCSRGAGVVDFLDHRPGLGLSAVDDAGAVV